MGARQAEPGPNFPCLSVAQAASSSPVQLPGMAEGQKKRVPLRAPGDHQSLHMQHQSSNSFTLISSGRPNRATPTCCNMTAIADVDPRPSTPSRLVISCLSVASAPSQPAMQIQENTSQASYYAAFKYNNQSQARCVTTHAAISIPLYHVSLNPTSREPASRGSPEMTPASWTPGTG